jgi:hypothetical protein
MYGNTGWNFVGADLGQRRYPTAMGGRDELALACWCGRGLKPDRVWGSGYGQGGGGRGRERADQVWRTECAHVRVRKDTALRKTKSAVKRILSARH